MKRVISDVHAELKSVIAPLPKARRGDGRGRDKILADVVGIFPNEESIERFIGAVLLAANDDRQLQCCHRKVEAIAALATPSPPH